MYKIYRLISPSGKSYIGYTKNTLAVRWSGHKNNYNIWVKSGRTRTDSCTKLFYAFDKYGFDGWSKEVLFEGEDRQVALSLENEFIEKYNSLQSGYNAAPGGLGGPGRKLSDQAKHNHSMARKRYYATDEGKLWLQQLSEMKKTTKVPKEKLPPKPRSDEFRQRCSENIRERQSRGLMIKQSQPESQKIIVSMKNSATWQIIHADGKIEIVTNLKNWAIGKGFNHIYCSNNFSGTGRYKGYSAIKIYDKHQESRNKKKGPELLPGL